MGSTVSEASRILIVDDDFEQVEMISLFLNYCGFLEVDSAGNLESLWGLLETVHYDVILLDYMLPDGTGLQVLNELSTRGHQVPVIMITGQGDERIAARAIQHGALDYLIKGDDYLETLPVLIRKAIHTNKLQLSIQRSEKQIRYQALLLSNVRDAVVVWDLDGSITYWNLAAEELFGWRADERLGCAVSKVYLQAFEPPIQLLEEYENTARHIERRCRIRDGRNIWVSSQITALYDISTTDQLIGYMDVVHDITERKQMEHQIQATQMQLVQAARLATIGEMASGIAHQIYNPLTTIIADAQLLLQELPQDVPGHDSAEAIEQAGWRLQSVVQRLLEFSRPASSTLEFLAVNRTIENAISLVGAHIEAVGVEIETCLAINLPLIHGNVRQLEDLWVNLLLLARDATQAEHTHKIQIRTSHGKDGFLLVEIGDNGRPIPDYQLASLFEPDFTGSVVARGSGLELSICREIVRQHNGQISAKCMPDGETIVSVSLPAMHHQMMNANQ